MASHQQKAWLEEYLQCWNATEAARRVGYKNAEVSGHNNKQKFEDEIAERLREKHMSADEVLSRIADMGRADLGPYMNDDGEVDIALVKDAGLTHLIHTIERSVRSGVNQNGSEWENANTKVKTYSALDALQLLARHHKLLTDKIEHEHSGSIDVTNDDLIAARNEVATIEKDLLSEPEG